MLFWVCKVWVFNPDLKAATKWHAKRSKSRDQASTIFSDKKLIISYNFSDESEIDSRFYPCERYRGRVDQRRHRRLVSIIESILDFVPTSLLSTKRYPTSRISSRYPIPSGTKVLKFYRLIDFYQIFWKFYQDQPGGLQVNFWQNEAREREKLFPQANLRQKT